MAGKKDVSDEIEKIGSAIANLDPRGDNDMVTMALIIVEMAQDSLKKRGTVQAPDALFEAAVEQFKSDNDREPEWR